MMRQTKQIFPGNQRGGGWHDMNELEHEMKFGEGYWKVECVDGMKFGKQESLKKPHRRLDIDQQATPRLELGT